MHTQIAYRGSLITFGPWSLLLIMPSEATQAGIYYRHEATRPNHAGLRYPVKHTLWTARQTPKGAGLYELSSTSTISFSSPESWPGSSLPNASARAR
jgi:hypothetical protein